MAISAAEEFFRFSSPLCVCFSRLLSGSLAGSLSVCMFPSLAQMKSALWTLLLLIERYINGYAIDIWTGAHCIVQRLCVCWHGIWVTATDRADCTRTLAFACMANTNTADVIFRWHFSSILHNIKIYFPNIWIPSNFLKCFFGKTFEFCRHSFYFSTNDDLPYRPSFALPKQAQHTK